MSRLGTNNPHFEKKYFLVIDDDEANAEEYSCKCEVKSVLEDLIEDGDFNNTKIRIVYYEYADYRAWEDQEVEEDIFECIANYNDTTDEVELTITLNDINYKPNKKIKIK